MAWNDARVFAASPLGSISGVVTALPGGFTLGEDRMENGIQYKLVYNAGGASITVGYGASPVPLNTASPYSVTVTTVSGSFNNYGFVVAHNATVPTAVYFWGAYRGYLASGLVAVTTSLTTNNVIHVGTDGKVNGGAAIASGFTSGNIAIGICLAGATVASVGVRQGAVLLTGTQY